MITTRTTSPYFSPNKAIAPSFNASSLDIDLITTGTYNDGKRGFKGWTDIEEKQLLDTLDYLNKNNIQMPDEAIMASVDSILYEAVPGDIVSQKKINVQGYQKQ